MVTLGIREITNAGLAQDIRPKVYSKACVSGKARSMPRLRWKNGLPGMLPPAQGTPAPQSGGPGGSDGIGASVDS